MVTILLITFPSNKLSVFSKTELFRQFLPDISVLRVQKQMKANLKLTLFICLIEKLFLKICTVRTVGRQENQELKIQLNYTTSLSIFDFLIDVKLIF